MEFWGVEVPSGKPLSCDPGKESYVHISQAALGENKNGKGSERVVLKVAVGNTEVVVGTLSQGRCDQTTLDLIFDREFKLSHNSAGSSVYFSGYKTDAVKDEPFSSDESSEESESSESEEDIPNPVLISSKENGKGKPAVKGGKSEVLHPKLEAKPPAPKVETPLVEVKPEAAKPEAAKPKPKPKEEEEDEDDDDEDDDDDEEQDGDDEDDEMPEGLSDEDDMESDEDDEFDEDDDESEDEEIKPGKKRPLDGMKTPVPEKKPKVGTPIGAGKPGPGGKKEARTPATPAPAPKQQQQSAKKDVSAKKTPAKENVSPKPKLGKEGSKASTPASGKKIGQFLCQTCNKNFQSESALTQHNTAKHK